MNSIEQNYLPIFREYQVMRAQLMDVLTDTDLKRDLGGETMTLGALCREIGEVEHAYVESFTTFKLDFAYRHPSPTTIETSVAALKAWYAELDHNLEAAVTKWSDNDIADKTIDRGGWTQPIQIALDVYKEALIIFYGTASIYLRAMRKSQPQQMADWIA